MARTPGLFDVEDRLQRLSDIGDQLEAFARVVDFEIFRPDLDGGAQRRRQGRPAAVRPCDDVQDPGDPGAQRSVRRPGRVPDQRPAVLHALPRTGPDRQGPDAKTIWVVPRAADQGRRHRGAVHPLRPRDPRGRLHSRWRARSSTPASSPRPGSATPTARRPTSRPAACRRRGRTSRRSCARRTATRAGRWCSARPGLRPDGTKHADIAIPGLRLQEPRRHRPPPRLHQAVGRHRCRRHDGRMARAGACWTRPTPRSTVWADSAYRSKANEAFMEKHGFRSQVHHRKPKWTAHGAAHPPRQCRPLGSPRRRGACLRPSEGADGALHPHHRPHQGAGEDRHGQHRLQHQPAGLAGATSRPA